MMVAAEFIMESMLDRIAPIIPAATKPTNPNPSGWTYSIRSTVKTSSPSTDSSIPRSRKR